MTPGATTVSTTDSVEAGWAEASTDTDPPFRRLARVTRTGKAEPGFAGPGHTAVEVFSSGTLALTDPFVLFMDDTLDFEPGQEVGSAHPHAGLETVTLVLEGSLDDAIEGLMDAGDLAWMTAGRGVIHNEHVKATGHARILQLWVALPRHARQISPELQLLPRATLPIRREPGVEARLYSGRTGVMTSPTRNKVPMTVVDFHLQAGAVVDQVLPGTDRAFLYVIEGAIGIGGDQLAADHVGWLDPVARDVSRLRIEAQGSGARALLVSGQPLKEPILHHGPFVAGSRHELAAYYRSFSVGHFPTLGAIVQG